MLSQKWPCLDLAIFPLQLEIKDANQAINPIAATVDNGWTIPRLPPNPKDNLGFHDRDEPPLSIGTTLAT